jgi:hypothetical protein
MADRDLQAPLGASAGGSAIQADNQPGLATNRHAVTPVSAELIPTEPRKILIPCDAKSFRIPQYDAAIERHSASFAQLAASIFYSRERFTKSSDERAVYEHYIAPLMEAFETAHGAITNSFYCENVIAAAALTAQQDRHELFVVSPSLDTDIIPIAEMIFECECLATESDRVLSGPKRLQDLNTTKTLTYEAIETFFRVSTIQIGHRRAAS